MKILSSGGLPKDHASLGVAPTEIYKLVNELPKQTSKLRNKGLESKNGFEEPGTYYNKKDTFSENYVQPEEHDTLYQGQKGGYHRSDYRMRKLKMPLFDGEDSHEWIYKVESKITVSFMGRFEEKIVGEISTVTRGYFVMEGTFIKGLRPELRSVVRVMQPEGLNHVMKLAMIIDENKAQSSLRLQQKDKPPLKENTFKE
ncbi:hypothetical protein Tco_1195411 [Tanacetum coccineum]